MSTMTMTWFALIAIPCWVLVFCAATAAVFSKQIDDTLTERIGLSAIAIASAAVAWHLTCARTISGAGLAFSVAAGWYVLALVIKIGAGAGAGAARLATVRINEQQ